MQTTLNRAFLLASIVGVLVCVPLATRAQTNQTTQNDLRATIRAELLSDPRTSGLTQAQIDAMVDALTQEAQKQGVTSQDIQWRPQQVAEEESAPPVADSCEGTPRFFCAFDMAFGFVGDNPGIAFMLGLASMGLIWLIAHILHHRHPTLLPPPPATPSA